jgi:hypothetical protein
VVKRKLSVIITLLLLSLTTATVLAQSSGNYDLAWSSIASGGSEASGGSFALNGAIGQADTGSLSGGSYTLNGGFLAGTGAAATTDYRVYLPLILR